MVQAMSEKYVMSDATIYFFIAWLKDHEDDIEHGYNDFGDLREIFWELVGRNAGEEDED